MSASLSTTSSTVAAGSSSQQEEENADEVKIFRTIDVDDVNNDEPLDDELAADKTDVAFEADIEPDSIGERSAFSNAQQNLGEEARRRAIEYLSRMTMPSPSYQIFLPLLRSPFSPFSPLYQPSAQMAAQGLAHLMTNSPSHTQQIVNLAAISALSNSGAFGPNSFGMFGNAPVLQTIPQAAVAAAAAANGFGVAPATSRVPPSTPTSSRMNNYGVFSSPVSSVAAGLNGMSLLEKNQQHVHKNVYKTTHTTPKRSQPYDLNTATGNNATNSTQTPKREKEKREEKVNHIKKPCNAFMWYMKMNRQRLLKEEGGQQVQSATINRRLGEEWQKLKKEEQEKYFKMAQQERDEHSKKYPDWTARDNYAIKKNKKKKLREKSFENNDQKKCRARYGIENQNIWCKHCKRKKRCLNVRDAGSPSQIASSKTNPQSTTASTSQSNKNNDDVLIRPTPLPVSSSQRLLNPQTGSEPPSVSAHISSASSTASTASRHLDSPSSSGAMSVGKRTESNGSSNFESATPPPNANAIGPTLLHSLKQQQIAQFLAAGGLGTPKMESGNPFFSANVTPLAPQLPNATQINNNIELTKTHLFAQLSPALMQQQQQIFNNFGNAAANPNFMAYFSQHNFK